jgi:hypothetical protein
MSRSVPIPYFPVPPAQYSQNYLAEVTRAFSVYAQQVNTPGPWRATELTLTEQTGNVDYGQLSWNIAEETVDIAMGDGVTQQVGFETYMRVKNNTGSQIDNGTVVGFVGVNSEITVAPYLANSSANELYFVGVTTRDMPDQDVGPVTLYGKVRGLDTTGPGAETWSVGDILYASPTAAGLLTNIRPTAPNAVIAVAAVLSVDAADGEIMVRPTIPIGLDYGSFDATVDQTLAATDTATPVLLTNTLVSNGVTLSASPNNSRLNVAEAGYYQIDAVLQLTSGNASDKNVYFWLRKNGSNVAETTRAITVNVNGGFSPIALNYTITLAANDYVEIYWAANNTNVTLDALAASAFAPAAPSVLVNMSQLQL